jgi:hypothetical protein
MIPAVGNALWTLLHAYAMSYPEIADDTAKAGAEQWLATWSALVEQNSTGCKSCHKKWLLLVERCPPNLTGKTSFYHWTVAAHDWVNQQLGKPRFTNAISLQQRDFGIMVPNG